MRRLVSLALAAALLASVAPACRNTPTAPDADATAATPMLVARETAKWSLLFGTASQRDSAVAWYAPDFVNVGYGATGLGRSGRSEMTQSLAFFPTLPAGAFRVSDMKTVQPGDGTVVVSYRIDGPGPTGGPWAAYAVSVWALRNGAWQTVFYQASQI
jgi:hypothetical protein